MLAAVIMTIFRLFFGREPTSPHLPGVARGHQFVIRQPVVIFFSSAYLVAASLTTELLSYLERAASALKKSVSRS
jgi:hypothetical protein